jgi:O-antigen/teichoic acid export membrane protein
MSRANIILQTCFLLLPLATLSLEEAILRFGLDKEKPSKLFSVTTSLLIPWDIIFFAILLPIFVHIDDTKGYIAEIIFCVYMGGVRKTCQQTIRSQQKVKLFAYDGIQTTLLFVFFTVLFMKVFDWGISGFILATAFSDFVSCIFLMTYGKVLKGLKLQLDFKLLKPMLKYSLPLMPTAILWWIVSASDLYMVRYMVGEEANGIYSTAYKIPTLIALASTIFYQAWQMSATIEKDTAKVFYTQVSNAFQSLLFIASAGVMLLLKPLTNILTASDYHQAYLYSTFLIIATLFGCFCQFSGAIYSAVKESKRSLYTSIIAAVSNVALNLILIPKFGVYGAAFSTMFAYGICAVIRQIDTQHIVGYKTDNLNFTTNLFLLGVMCLSYFTPITPLFLIPAFVLIVFINFQSLLHTFRLLF